MAQKLKMWNEHSTWKEAEQTWDAGAKEAAKTQPVRGLSQLPSMPGITKETSKHLKWKSFQWIITKDHKGEVRRGFFKHPLKYGWAYVKSVLKGKPYRREKDFFLYGVKSVDEFQKLLENPNSIFVVGFSYCHKPFECPSGRFTPECIHEPEHPICRQCFIGKAINALPENNSVALAIPTVHYIGGKIFEIVHNNPGKDVLFIITACEMTLEMFGDLGNMAGIKGVGVRLDGRICNTMKAFELSENGVKPGITVVLDDTKQKILDLIQHRREGVN
ncbi:MAG: hypothetical protein K940chlam7_02070 [Chlamydiae bacterium]|nr:hypothetical protein [Chlamydiota bacterium]